MTGSTLLDGRYQVITPLCSGAMGCVYKARDLRLDRLVAVKQLKPSLPGCGEEGYGERRFREEARMLASLAHRGLPRVSDYFVEETGVHGTGRHYLVMDLIEGKDGQALMEERVGSPLPLPAALGYMAEVLEILDYLHTHSPPIIYRDLNPRNIMLGEKNLFLVDFGIATLSLPGRRGTAIGTPGYAAPEQYRGEAEPRSDLYSCGVMMHYFLSGRDPEKSSRRHFAFEPLRSLNPMVPERLESLVMSMVEVVPQRRPPSAEAALLEARQVMNHYRFGHVPSPSIQSFRNIYITRR